jgi:hypothetical protein
MVKDAGAMLARQEPPLLFCAGLPVIEGKLL